LLLPLFIEFFKFVQYGSTPISEFLWFSIYTYA
jgi:hypothetical protein